MYMCVYGGACDFILTFTLRSVEFGTYDVRGGQWGGAFLPSPPPAQPQHIRAPVFLTPHSFTLVLLFLLWMVGPAPTTPDVACVCTYQNTNN